VEHVEKLLATEHALEKQVEQLKNKLAQEKVSGLSSKARQMQSGAPLIVERVDGMDRQQMRSVADSLRNQKTGVVVLASAEDGNISIVAAVRKDLTGKFHAGKVAGALAQAVGGKGGGRPDMAEGGGKDVAALDAALANARQDLEKL